MSPYRVFYIVFRKKYDIRVVAGTHPIPEKYYTLHKKIGTWNSPMWEKLTNAVMTDEKTRRVYD